MPRSRSVRSASPFLARKMFFVTGKGVHRHRLASFEAALRDAGIEKFNLVYVSSIFPPGCKIVEPEDGLAMLTPGQIVYCVMARIDTDEPSRRITSALGLAVPQSRDQYGYISEHHAYGVSQDYAEEYSEDLAATMLATTLGIEFDPDEAWNERKQIYQASGRIIRTQAFSECAEGCEDGLWTTVLAAAVFVM